MISIKDYARETGVTYEAVRQRIKRYQDELDGHIHRQGRTQYLDDVAVAFLNDHRLQNPTVVYDRAAGEEFRELKAEIQEVKDRASEYWKQLKAKDGMIQVLIEENKDLRLQAASVALLEADNQVARQKAEAAEQEKKLLEQTLADIEAQNASLSAEKAEAEDKARLEAETAQKAAERLQRAEEEKTAWQEYASALEAYNALGWFKRRKAEKPVPPAQQEE